MASGASIPERINADGATVEQGLAKLVLALIELIRRLLEKQAMRRIDAGSVGEEDIERMGETFLKLDLKMAELKATFGLQDEDLNLNLGPLGDLMSEEEVDVARGTTRSRQGMRRQEEENAR
jgi:hypothetical protein